MGYAQLSLVAPSGLESHFKALNVDGVRKYWPDWNWGLKMNNDDVVSNFAQDRRPHQEPSLDGGNVSCLPMQLRISYPAFKRFLIFII